MEGSRHILVVDDDQERRKLLSNVLTSSGFRVSLAANGAAMTQVLEAARIDLVVLDIMLPAEDGLMLCRKLRLERPTPIIMLTEIGSEVDRVVDLEMGADDYLPKPLSTLELLARIRAVLRRSTLSGAGLPAENVRVLEFAGWELDVTRRQLHSPAGALVAIRAAEFDIFLALAERANSV